MGGGDSFLFFHLNCELHVLILKKNFIDYQKVKISVGGYLVKILIGVHWRKRLVLRCAYKTIDCDGCVVYYTIKIVITLIEWYVIEVYAKCTYSHTQSDRGGALARVR